uniref:hypothetical protein n=1 Tax=Endozoicomonas sp. SESOKO1 TaxID=2828742 RepID=UPI0021477B8F
RPGAPVLYHRPIGRCFTTIFVSTPVVMMVDDGMTLRSGKQLQRPSVVNPRRRTAQIQQKTARN